MHVAATLGLCDLLADGPRTAPELAAATGTDPHSLSRLMRALAAVGLFVVDGDGRFANTELGDAFRTDAPRSVAGWARFIGDDRGRLRLRAFASPRAAVGDVDAAATVVTGGRAPARVHTRTPRPGS